MKKFIVIGLILTLGLLAALGVLDHLRSEESRKPMPVLSQVPVFELTDSENKAFQSSALQGKAWIADFVFTRCQGPCPLLTKHVASLAKQYAAEPGLAFVTITVDPEFDTPTVLSDYAKRFEADTTRWHFLTGTPNQIQQIMTKDFKLGFDDKIIFHSDRLVLVDKHGQVRGYYEGSDKNALNKLAQDVALIVKEP